MTDEKTLVLWMNKGDEESFDYMFSTYYPSVLSVAAHMTGDMAAARDIVQEVFARFWANRRKYADLKSPKDFLFIATRNQAISYLRSKRTVNKHRDSIIYEERFRAGLVEEETYILLTEAIAQLPPRTGEVIRLSLQGLLQEEIAAQMGIALPTVKSLKADGIRKLRQRLGHLAVLVLYI